MNNLLDKLQENITRELIQVQTKANNGIEDLITTLQGKEEEIHQTQVNIENIKKYARYLPWFGPVLIPLLCFPVIYQGGYSSFPVNL
jgi:hypothetical protein